MSTRSKRASRAKAGLVIKPHQVLPAVLADALRRIYVPGSPSDELCSVLAAARARGWTLTAMANALGVTRERIRQLANAAPDDLRVAIEIPEPPCRPEPVRPEKPQLTAQQVQELRDLHRQGKPRGGQSADHPKSVAARKLGQLINEYHAAGHTLAELTAALGLKRHASIQVLLGRCGYRNLPPSQRFGPGPYTDGYKVISDPEGAAE